MPYYAKPAQLVRSIPFYLKNVDRLYAIFYRQRLAFCHGKDVAARPRRLPR